MSTTKKECEDEVKRILAIGFLEEENTNFSGKQQLKQLQLAERVLEVENVDLGMKNEKIDLTMEERMHLKRKHLREQFRKKSLLVHNNKYNTIINDIKYYINIYVVAVKIFWLQIFIVIKY